jgi:hypothetical protein
MASNTPTALEKNNLEAHVGLCQERYNQLERRLTTIEIKVGSIHDDVKNGNKATTRVIIGSAATIIGGLLSTLVVLLIAFL